MKVNETAQIAMRLMTEPELARFVRGRRDTLAQTLNNPGAQ